VFSVESTFSQPTYHAGHHEEVSQFVTTASNAFGATTFTRSEEIAITSWTESRMEPYLTARPADDNLPLLNEVRHRCHPIGIAGFGGAFTASALSVHLTTTQGLAAGSTFAEVSLTPPAAMSAIRGVSFHPIDRYARFGGTAGAAATRLIEVPSVMTSQISVAATWTSTTTTGPATSDTAVTSRAATHTLALTSSVTGDFWSAEAITFNSDFRSEILPGGAGNAVGGYVAGDNILGHTYQVLVRAGCMRWSPYSNTQSTVADTYTVTGPAGSVSTTIAAECAIVLTMENVLSAAWSHGGNGSVFSSALHLSH
jgi:hypothetical protein